MFSWVFGERFVKSTAWFGFSGHFLPFGVKRPSKGMIFVFFPRFLEQNITSDIIQKRSRPGGLSPGELRPRETEEPAEEPAEGGEDVELERNVAWMVCLGSLR